jgi:nucleotide-binding universal stress UspA family protein
MKEKMKILIAYDGSDCADAALDDLRRAGLPRVLEALVVSVAEVWLPPPTPPGDEINEEAGEVHGLSADMKAVYAGKLSAVEEARALAQRARERLQSNFPEWTVSSEALYGSPAWEIIMKADEWEPDLIVVGSHGRSALERLVLGSVSQKIVTEARCSVRVARGRLDEPDAAAVRIVVAVDGSPGSQRAVREVANRAWPQNTEARVVVVVDDPLTLTLLSRLIPPVARLIEEASGDDPAWVQKIVDEALKELSATELSVSSNIAKGDPKRVLVEEAETWSADCVFVGSTGFGSRLERFMLGSVSSAVVARAHCSVEVVRKEEKLIT